MRGSDFVGLAGALVEGAATPAQLRTAVSRAYYGAYLEVREILRPFCGKVKIDEYSSHANVRVLLRNCGVKDCDAVAKFLGELHLRRQEADYELHRRISREQARACIDQAETIISFMSPLATGAGRRALRDGLYGYLQRTQQLGGHYPG